MPTAIVTGATGILGREIVQALGKDSKWTKIHALSRSQKDKYPPTVQHNHLDLTGDAQVIAKELKSQGVEGEYLFFAAYLAKDDEKEASDVNGAMLKNFIEALAINGTEKKLKRVILTTGAKQYGVHLGPVKCPMEESDPWIEGEGRPPNFYYTQQRILYEAAKKGGWDWVVTYPNDVIGVAKGNFMNLSTALALYATICKELGGDLEFPGSEKFYTRFDCFTYSRLHAAFNLWAALEPKCTNQAFNVVNGDTESWTNMWPKLARRFGCKVPPKQFQGKARDASEMVLQAVPPFEDLASENGMQGEVAQGKVRQRINLTKWSQRKEVKDAWEQIAKREGVQEDALEKATWGFLGFVLGREYDIVISMSKARKFGWTGYIDTWESMEATFDELEQEKIVPKTK
ncbi:related to wound-inducible protein AWI 31 [Phialocephala subalpina]|uniref:Related to wound-inducible protein AWI 31 n=1 Tax=Phialocephala subalpina TaxID=576137 RepID=A0A1L7WL72_9HELO|nr:related to wound-inducible protein AWI 31 [Phialocephala subalpina]